MLKSPIVLLVGSEIEKSKSRIHESPGAKKGALEFLRPTRPSLRSQQLGTPDPPAVRFTRDARRRPSLRTGGERPNSGARRGLHLLLCFARDARRGRQLQHGRPLAFAQTGDQHDLSIGEFQGVVMHVRAIHVELPESSHLISKLAELHPRQQAAKRMVALYLALECHFGAGKKTHCHIRLSDGSKTAREKVELRRHQLVSDLCRSRRDVVKTVIAHLKVVLLLRTAGMVVLLCCELHQITMAIVCRCRRVQRAIAHRLAIDSLSSNWRNDGMQKRHAGTECRRLRSADD